MTTERRLAGIEKRLTPRQVVLAYLEDVRGRFKSLGAWLEAVMFRQEQEPLDRMIPAAEAAVREAMKGEPKETVARKVKDARLEVIFLHHLAIDVQVAFLHDSDASNLRAALCARGVQVLLLDAAGDGAGLDDGPQRIRGVREEVEHCAAKVYLHREAVEVVQRNYFDGRPVLFDEEARLLKVGIDTAETVIEEYNRLLRDRPERVGEKAEGLLIDVGAVRDLARSNVRREAAYMVNLAKVTAMTNAGMRNEGRDLLKEVHHRRYPDGRRGEALTVRPFER